MAKNRRKGFDDLIARRAELSDISPPWTEPAEPATAAPAPAAPAVQPDPPVLAGVVVPADPDAVPAPYEGPAEGDLSDQEREDLTVCEAAVDNLRRAFWAAGKALQTIRDARLYRATHSTFEAYLVDRWEMRTSQAYRLIQAWPLAERLSPIGDKINEAQVRELLPLADRHGLDAATTVYRTVAETDGVKVTAAVLGEVVRRLPGDRWDPAEVVEQIRAYLSGQDQTANRPPADPDPEATWKEEADRLRTLVRRAVHRPAFRTALRERPTEARAVVAELRALLDEIEAEAGAEGTDADKAAQER